MEWLSKFNDLVKLPMRYSALVAFVTGAILLLPKPFLRRIHLETIPAPYGAIVGLVFLTTSGLVIVNAICFFEKRFTANRRIAKRKGKIKKYLNELDAVEQAVLGLFILGDQSTINLPLDHPVVAGLIDHGIIRQVGRYGSISHYGMMFNFRISDTAAEHITPQVLGLAECITRKPDGNWVLTDEAIKWIAENSPPFAQHSLV